MAFPPGRRAWVRLSAARALGALSLGMLLSGCVQNPAAGRGPFPTFAEFAGDEVVEVTWAGDLRLPVDSLDAVTVMHAPTCRVQFLPRSLCIGGEERYVLDLVELQTDVFRLQLYYRDHGYYGTRVVPSVERAGVDEVSVRFAIVPGDQVTLQSLAIEGTDSILDPEQIRRQMPLKVGEPFRRVAFLASADTIQVQLQRRGYAYAQVLRNFSTTDNVAAVDYQTIPGPVVTVDSIVVLGSDRLSRRTILKQINVRQGEILQVPELVASQRNLYQLSIVSFAAVEMAPDSLQLDPDSTSATVVVRVVEAAKYLLNPAVGYGSVDCFRTGTRLTDRNFIGGGRTLELSAAAAKIGVGYPTNVGLENNLCRRLEDDPFSQELTYRVAANFVQPRLLGTRTALTAAAHAERRAELTLFLRESVGSQFAVSRDVGRGLVIGLGAQVERGRTESTPAMFCVIFAACTEDDAEPLSDPRWSNALTLSGTLDRTRLVATDTRGFQARTAVAWASEAFGSDDRYLSVLGEITGYRPLHPGWTLAGRVQAGQFVTGLLGLEESFIPPERRFYAGGPTTVRGFPPNALGPQAYVARDRRPPETPVRYPLGGTRVLVSSLELNTPSPFLPAFLRLAAFVDAGQVWATGLDRNDPGFETANDPLRVTPGLGVRFTTPVGPIRVDVGYNAYAPPPGPLYLTLEDSRGRPTGDLLFDGDYTPPFPTFLDRLEFHIAVGQAF